jgi:hypothetical protein
MIIITLEGRQRLAQRLVSDVAQQPNLVEPKSAK